MKSSPVDASDTDYDLRMPCHDLRSSTVFASQDVFTVSERPQIVLRIRSTLPLYKAITVQFALLSSSHYSAPLTHTALLVSPTDAHSAS